MKYIVNVKQIKITKVEDTYKTDCLYDTFEEAKKVLIIFYVNILSVYSRCFLQAEELEEKDT